MPTHRPTDRHNIYPRRPSPRTSTVDSCPMILRDWSCGPPSNPADIDAERGVIVNEWRPAQQCHQPYARKGFARPLRRHCLLPSPHRADGCCREFQPEVLRRFYDRWNVPANQAVIVTGDIDVDAVEKQVRTTFGSIPRAAPRSRKKAVRRPYPWPTGLVAVVAFDAGQGSGNASTLAHALRRFCGGA